jgi:hypothetical protein
VFYFIILMWFTHPCHDNHCFLFHLISLVAVPTSIHSSSVKKKNYLLQWHLKCSVRLEGLLLSWCPAYKLQRRVLLGNTVAYIYICLKSTLTFGRISSGVNLLALYVLGVCLSVLCSQWSTGAETGSPNILLQLVYTFFHVDNTRKPALIVSRGFRIS